MTYGVTLGEGVRVSLGHAAGDGAVEVHGAVPKGEGRVDGLELGLDVVEVFAGEGDIFAAGLERAFSGEVDGLDVGEGVLLGGSGLGVLAGDGGLGTDHVEGGLESEEERGGVHGGCVV